MTNEELLKVIEDAKVSGATELDLSGNQLTTLPPEIGQLTSLTELNLSLNHLSALPLEICQLTKLQRLNLRGNQFSTLPPEICQLKKLTVLDLSFNQLTTLPPELCQLTNLVGFDLSGNQFSSLPLELYQLMKLMVLDLSFNLLTTLPPELCQLTNLRGLNLSVNQLTTLPPKICQLTKLEYFNLNNNPLTSPPPEIAEKGIDAIRQYFAAHEAGTQPLNEVKLLIVGEGAAGKTSLVNTLLKKGFNRHEETTHGISILGCTTTIQQQRVRINIWDFGGQEIQHATHQFFLSKRSLYILVLDGRRDERTEYWLRHIEAFGGDSPVLVVLNKQDSNPSFDVNRPFLLQKYPSIRGFFRVSCKTSYGIADFKKAMLTELINMPMLNIHWPKPWFTVKRRLEKLDRPYISAEEYRGICKEAGITEEESRETLVDFLHDLGVAVHFKDFRLDAMNVLDPVWVTNAVYKIITAKQMADNKGSLHLKCLGKILPHGEEEKLSCPLNTHPYIMGLMQKFELCYELSKDSVLIPQLLTVSEPKLTFEQDGSLRFALHYPDFLPPSVFPRFMVKVHKDIHENTCWRTGVLLEDKRSGAQALVKADVEARRINIWVQGDNPREYLHYLRYLFADINSTFEKLKVMELVPMPDAEDITADYATLLEYEKNNIDKYIPTGSTKVYSVHELLGLVQPKDTKELAVIPEKMDLDPAEKVSLTDMLISAVEITATPPFITLNITELFKEIRAWDKQRQQQSRN